MTLLLALLLAEAATLPAAPRASIGVWDRWGAFAGQATAPCYAIAAPVRSGAAGRRRAFASVAARVGSPPRAAFFARLSTARRGGATVAIGERRFELAGSGTDVLAPDAATDRALVSAMRGARSMSIEAVSARGTPFADVYALRGAATAIDAATLACATR